MERAAQRAFTAYGYANVIVQPAQSGYRNTSFAGRLSDGQTFNLIIYKDEPAIVPRIRRANRFGNHLALAGLPARETATPRILRIHAGSTRYASLYEYLPGATIPWEAYTQAHIKQLGQTMGEIHLAALNFQATDFPAVADEYTAIFERMQAYFAQPDVRAAIQAKLGVAIRLRDFRHTLQLAKTLPNHRALHMDLVRGNVLFENAELTGILDFEKTAVGPPVFDLARTLAFLLVDCKYKPAHKVQKYFLQSGYVKRGDGQLPDPTLLEELTTLFLTYDFYKFLRHNPYESLAANEHYVRTRDMLIGRGIL